VKDSERDQLTRTNNNMEKRFWGLEKKKFKDNGENIASKRVSKERRGGIQKKNLK